jgi:hypothetical protein
MKSYLLIILSVLLLQTLGVSDAHAQTQGKACRRMTTEELKKEKQHREKQAGLGMLVGTSEVVVGAILCGGGVFTGPGAAVAEPAGYVLIVKGYGDAGLNGYKYLLIKNGRGSEAPKAASALGLVFEKGGKLVGINEKTLQKTVITADMADIILTTILSYGATSGSSLFEILNGQFLEAATQAGSAVHNVRNWKPELIAAGKELFNDPALREVAGDIREGYIWNKTDRDSEIATKRQRAELEFIGKIAYGQDFHLQPEAATH